MSEQTLAQRRAADALKKIQNLESKDYGKYVSYVKGLPAALLMNGLGQAAATLLSSAKGKKEDPHRLLYDHLSSWLCRDDDPASDLLESITKNDENHYLCAQAEALAYLDWLKKFARAFLKEKK